MRNFVADHIVKKSVSYSIGRIPAFDIYWEENFVEPVGLNLATGLILFREIGSMSGQVDDCFITGTDPVGKPIHAFQDL